ncbi:MAG: outer membrane beta-barrel protein [Chitinophagaceae bacterium]|nr:outer membrane beta-barrel protein [Chitinophagaceae bacterium]
MKKIIYFFLLLPVSGFSQNTHIGFRFGLANYQGDLQQKRFTFKQAEMTGSIGARYDLSEHFTGCGFISYGTIKAADAENKSTSLQQRNLSFESRIKELELSMQYNIFSLNDQWWTPYAFAGVAFFNFKPYAYDNNGTKTFLQPLSTEGQGFIAGRKEYKRTVITIPFGIGAEYALNEDMRVGLELGYRRTFTDYMDDVSTTYVDQAQLQAARGSTAVQMAYRGNGTYPAGGSLRGNDDNKDGYYFVQLTFTIRPYVDWYKRTSGISSFKKQKRVGCPGSQ